MILPTTVQAQQTIPAAKRLNELGPKNSQLAQRVGTWDVTETVWETPGATPISNKFVAERKMIGSFLQEIIRPLPNSNIPDFQRIYYLSFNRVEGRWKYVSIDTRNPVGLMPAASFGPGEKGKFTLTFDPFALAGPGMNVAGQMLRMEEVISQQDANHDTGEEYFILADGSGKRWLAYKYDYVRRTTPSK
ncbi:MAG: hypothetical protein AVDCRST_MAG95-2181 [uncultured Adhaeribacter sp.]|uniref:DUF1579 domain-containing protein n=1 Tax=uncultured Adhaeribacter sp. TaxID=448109 RepID=A0A6J4IS03_9BACT|nr:MAG: hypothetical protein AVDCRST_MAG95-2181 [uncultured Adhaeribacter sp.]